MKQWIPAWTLCLLLGCGRECPEPWKLVGAPPHSNSLALPVKKVQVERFIKEDEAVAKDAIATFCSNRFERAYMRFIRNKYFTKNGKKRTFGRDDYELFPVGDGEPQLTVHEISFSLLMNDTSLYFRALENVTKPPNDMFWDPKLGVYREVPYLIPRIAMVTIAADTTLDQLTRTLSKVSGYPYYQVTQPESKSILLAIIYLEDIDVPMAIKRARLLKEDPLISDVKIATCYQAMVY